MIVIIYQFNPGFMTHRVQHRADHLSFIERYVAEGKVYSGGALPERLLKGLILFRGSSEEAENFVLLDPYVRAGLVADTVIGEWSIVVGNKFEEEG